MRVFAFLLSLLLTIALVVALSWRIDPLPPLGYFLDPFHGFWQNAQGEDPGIETDLVLPNLRAPVTVQYDSLLIPHIFAQNDADLYRAQGYVQASLRYWQMDFVARVAAGRLSEVVGARAREFDRGQRRKGLMFAAEKALRLMEEDPVASAVLQAYTEGVNSYVNNLRYEDWPIEYKLLDYEPEPWTPLKTSLLLKYMADDLAGHDEDLENTNALLQWGKERFDFLYPQYYPDAEPVISADHVWNFAPIVLDTPSVSFVGNQLTTKVIPKPDPDNGSNNWAVSGLKTKSGNPILANDPHLGLNLPSIWFVVQLHTPELNVLGATLPGSPSVIIGANDSIAWGVTNATRDVRDWYKITFNDPQRNEYLFDGRLLKAQPRIETIRIRGEQTFYDTVVYTHYGPVVYDRSFPADTIENPERNYAMKWPAHDPSMEMMTFYYLNRADNYEDYRQALRYYATPAQNFVFASVQGDIALSVQGKFPAKWPGQGQFLMDGSQPEQEWQSYIPFEHNAYERNPPRGFVSSANQIPVNRQYPYFFYDKGYEHFRNRRINERLSSMKRITPEDMMALQADNYNQKAADILPMMLDSLDDSQLRGESMELYKLLRDWDFRNELNRRAPTVFSVWWSQLKEILWDEMKGQSVALTTPTDAATIHYLKNYPQDSMVDRQSTTYRETVNDLLNESFATTEQVLSNWVAENEAPYTWGGYKATSIQHMLRLNPFGIYNVPIGGGRGIVNATSERHGPSWRMVVELSDPVNVWGVYPGGQSGNPGSAYYDNQVDAWAAGKPYQLQKLADPEENANLLLTQTLSPTDAD
jgi:penicillin amidase